MTVELDDGLLVLRSVLPVLGFHNQFGSIELVSQDAVTIKVYLQTGAKAHLIRICSRQGTNGILATYRNGRAVVSSQ